MRHRGAWIVAVVTLVMETNGCTQLDPYRFAPIEVDGVGATVNLRKAECWSGTRAKEGGGAGTVFPPCEPNGPSDLSADQTKTVGLASIQRRHYAYKGPGETIPTQRGDYDLAFVEFDDQGWFARRSQMEALFMQLRRIQSEAKAPENGHALIIVYVHGWKHNASPCDDNVICFSRLLERMDILERELWGKGNPHRRLVGVYVGWRGLSVEPTPLSNITFWTRKAAAERVGRGGVTELFARLDDYRRARNANREDDKTQLVITGHSFGGLVVYSALAHALMERAGQVVGERCGEDAGSRSDPGATCYETARSFGDLIVLVNPAFEGSLYEPLFHIATNRCYSARQRPVMLTVTSRGDGATGAAFPFGRWFSTRFEHARSEAQKDSIREAVGHDERYQTHELRWKRRGAKAGVVEDVREEECGCRNLQATDRFEWWNFKASLDVEATGPVRAESVSGMQPASGPNRAKRVYTVYGDDISLIGDERYSANFPYLMVKADAEIIKNHNAIYNEPFIRFLHSFFLVHIAAQRPFEAIGCVRRIEACEPGGRVPCEQSCQLPNGGSCSGRTTEDLKSSR